MLAVTGTYLQLMATTALIEEQRAEVQYAEASYKQARAQADAGNKAPIDANRSLVELQTEQQRLRSQLGDMQKQKNTLARLIGLPLGLDIKIAEKLEALPADTASGGRDGAAFAGAAAGSEIGRSAVARRGRSAQSRRSRASAFGNSQWLLRNAGRQP